MHEVTGYTISAMPHLQKLRGTENVNGKNIYSDKSVARKIILKSPTVKGDYSYGSVYAISGYCPSGAGKKCCTEL